MVAKTVELPNVRKMFTPDPGHIVADADLDRADLQVVVWESGDEGLKRMMRQGVDMHIANGCDLLGVTVPPVDELVESHPRYSEHKARYGKQRYFAKRWIHGTNYGGQARTMAIAAGITVAESDRLQKRWFSMHPGIAKWHERTRFAVTNKHQLWNVFGQRRVFFTADEAAFREGLAWTPQSVVGRVINTGLLRIDAEPDIDLLLQVHDSLVLQFSAALPLVQTIARIRVLMEVIVPYPDPLVIPVSVKASSMSWGHCEQLKNNPVDYAA